MTENSLARRPLWPPSPGDLAAFACLLALACATAWPIFGMRPLGGDNLYVLAWADAAPASALLRIDPAIYPQWRPLAYQTVWLEHHLFSLDGVVLHYAVNLAFWLFSAWLVYRIVDALADSAGGGLLAGALVLTDRRSASALTWIVERQTSMACAFGLLALLIVVLARHRRLRPLEWAGIALLLLASALSKEYGLAFAAALAVHALAERRKRIALAALCAALVYVVLRMSVAGGGVARYCEEMAYFSDWRYVCMDALTPTAIRQGIYNIAGTAVGILMPGLLAGGGQISVQPLRLAASLPLLVLAAVAWLKGTTPIRTTALVVAFNALLSFLIYRDRNQLIGVCAIGIAVGVGGVVCARTFRARGMSRVAQVSGVVLLMALVARQAIGTHAEIASQASPRLAEDPCEAPVGTFPYTASFIRSLKLEYGMGDVDCGRRQ